MNISRLQCQEKRGLSIYQFNIENLVHIEYFTRRVELFVGISPCHLDVLTDDQRLDIDDGILQDEKTVWRTAVAVGSVATARKTV